MLRALNLKWFALGIILFFGFVVVAIWIYKLPAPPVSALDKARLAISSAQKSHSGKYSSKLFNESVVLYDSAMYFWAIENKKFFLNRRYDKIARLARQSYDKAIKAKRSSKTNQANLKSRLSSRISEIDLIVRNFDRNFSKLPIASGLKTREVRAKLLYAEGKMAFNKSDYISAAEKIDKGGDDIEDVYNISKKRMQEYFQEYKHWVKNFDDAVSQSRKKESTVIIVEKLATSCYLYKSGQLINTWEAEFGKNWIGDKRQRGDYATPEGVYYITNKKNGSSTTYYKALPINYPNEADKEKFAKQKRNGSISTNTGIGSNIQIHGGGGRGAHWTEGCIALSNSAMDKIFSEVGIGTPVVIIGSLRKFDDIFKFD